VKLENVLVHGLQSTNTIDLIGVEDQRSQLDRVGRALPRLWRLGPAITVNRRSMSRDDGWESLQSKKVKLVDVLVHGLQ
jgi:hypothetical protein